VKIAFCASEAFPFAKTGGLADVAGALPVALAKRGAHVKIFMPLYKGIKPQRMHSDYGYSKYSGVEIYFIKHDGYFRREGYYGTGKQDYADNAERFAFYSRATMKLMKDIDFTPDIIHCNDWQSAMVLVYAKTLYAYDNNFVKAKGVYTIHNLAYQGIFDGSDFAKLDLPWSYFNVKYLEFYGKINFMKAGIVFADAVNTVSNTYAKQIQMPEYGCGLEGVLKEKRRSLSGIINGIDYKVWDPAADKIIAKKYSAKSFAGKAENKKHLQKISKLKIDKDVFLLGMVGRLVEQKGVDILFHALNTMLKKYQIVILGIGDEKYHTLLKQKAKKFKNSFSLSWCFDEKMAHDIYAGCDAFLMPSRFEPCGLSQMIGYRYATVPIVHATGGLVDTVADVKRGGGGFVFEEYSSHALSVAVQRACEMFENKKEWAKLLKKITAYDYSWDKAAARYLELYSSLKKGV